MHDSILHDEQWQLLENSEPLPRLPFKQDTSAKLELVQASTNTIPVHVIYVRDSLGAMMAIHERW